MTWSPDCMSAEEYAVWQAANQRIPWASNRASSPCRDCPLSWREEQQAAGLCNTNAVKGVGRLRLPDTPDRQRWRDAQRRKRARRAA